MRKQLFIGLISAAALMAGCKSEDKKDSSSALPESSKAPVAAAPANVTPTTMPAIAAAAKMAPTTKPALVATYGGDQRLPEAQTVPVDKLLLSPGDYDGKYVRFSGIVSSVCPAKGCWLRVTSEPGGPPGDVFVKFPDPPEGRLIPMNAVGHDITVEGLVRNAKITEAQAKHLKQDAGTAPAELDKIVGDQPQVMVGKPAVAIEGIEKTSE